jgi:hypothetical protein
MRHDTYPGSEWRGESLAMAPPVATATRHRSASEGKSWVAFAGYTCNFGLMDTLRDTAQR